MTDQLNTSNDQASDNNNGKEIGDKVDEWHKRGVTKNYYRMEAKQALKHIEDLRKPGFEVPLEKIEDDERRILKNRTRLCKVQSTKELLEKLQKSFEDWWVEAKSDKDTVIKHSWDQRWKLVKPQICSEPGKDARGTRDSDDPDDPAHDYNAAFMFFEKDEQHWKGVTYQGQAFPKYENFPHQRISVHKALYDNTHNPFDVTQDENGQRYLRYIHLPANHMGQAMSRYHCEHEKDTDKRVKTNQTLSREFWKGQLHGSGLGRNPIHATHMRSRCSVIPGVSPTAVESKMGLRVERRSLQKDVAVFEEEAKNGPLKHRSNRSATMRQNLQKYKVQFQPPKHDPRELVEKWKEKREEPSKLGRYLLHLAQLWEAMDVELDERLVKKSLVSRDTEGRASEPSLHVRRTLDQSYFLNLNDTSQRDQDQVVYRATQGRGNLTRVVMVDQLWLWVLDEPFIIIDQCSSVFFDRTKPLDLRPEVMDIFAETLGDVNHYTTIAFKTFWRHVEGFSQHRENTGSNRQSQRYLDINPEGTLLREAQDIAEELRIMTGIFSQQLGVVKSFQKCLEHMNGDPNTRTKPHHWAKTLQHLVDLTKGQETASPCHNEKPISSVEMDFLEDLVEEVENRKSEITDLESAALQTCQQLQELLSLKQQQASIVEAKAALDRADQSVEQGKAIMAFTIMTIIFTPLGFFTSFFGMNNSLTGADWMSLGYQCLYMLIIICALSLAFKGSKIRQFVKSPLGQFVKSPFGQFIKPLLGKSTKPLKKFAFKKQGRKNVDGEKQIEEVDVAPSSAVDIAKRYFQVVGGRDLEAGVRKTGRRGSQAPKLVENIMPNHK
ncbi:hypothetical protein J7T55_004525 [Diaporthe amygdali]|uniref:uncharacterized protein n=1 Tax=Phomopsis amygdali TaxID=1214568 RepID=UPI0022FEE820|nr:uncharacterized protein J7T55_004525 [Diaporthe amygdali]KAJ0114784.1 hypothetical protein J7T55_004525 [Diaporthe amygdali]